MTYLKLLILTHRAMWFYLGYSLLTIFYAPICLLLCPFLPRRARHKMIIFWCIIAIHWVRICCGVRYNIIGKENIPKQPCVIVSKHQSPFETFLLQILFSPMATVLKIELTRIPLFGWAMKYLEPIVIDRKKKKAALKQVIDQGRSRITEGFWILIFPEGTRIPSGQSSSFSKGGFVLAKEIGAPVVSIAHNAGDHWPAKRFLKYPGTIQIEIGQVTPTDNELRDIMKTSAKWISQKQHEMSEIERKNNTKISIKC